MVETLPDIELFNGGWWATAVEGVRGDSIETSTVTNGYINGPFATKQEAEASTGS